MIGLRLMLCGLLSLSFPSRSDAEASSREPLPSPLSLEQALLLADQTHPDRELAEANLQLALAERAQVDAEDDLALNLSAALSAVEPSPNALDQSHNDSWAKVGVSKLLYDFGRTHSAMAVAEARLQGQKWHLLDVRQQRLLEVMKRFFDVILADLEAARDNEAMSIDYVRLDRARSRNELGQLSDVELLELENRYQQARRVLQGSRNKQRITRSLLAVSLNRPDDLPAELLKPQPVSIRERELETLVQEVLAGNAGRQVLRASVESAEQALVAVDREDNPQLKAELAVAAYNRDLGGRNPLSASLIFELPLYTGNRVDAKKAEQRARLREQRAKFSAYELELRQQVLEHWLELQRLAIRKQELQATEDYRDLFLERSRTLYDLEVASDLGDSMVQIADLHLLQAQTDFQLQLIQARLEALAGNLLVSVK